MADERAPFPTDDPREKGTSDQNTEENPDSTTPREGEPGDRGQSPDTPGTSREDEGDPAQATGNPAQ
jgi:hypothetical protein